LLYAIHIPATNKRKVIHFKKQGSVGHNSFKCQGNVSNIQEKANIFISGEYVIGCSLAAECGCVKKHACTINRFYKNQHQLMIFN
jgi:hypothetical protein